MSRRLTAALLALTATLTTTGAAAAATDDGTVLLTVDGTVQQAVVDDFADHGTATEHHEPVLDTMVEVGGELYDLPEDVAGASAGPDGVRAGDHVEVTVRAAAGTSPVEALASAADPATPATVVDVVPAGTDAQAQARVEATAPAVLGDRTLTLLPVHWGTAPASPSPSALTALATSAAAYWSEQSAGGVRFQPVAREWRQIPDPGSCDTTAIMREALAAYGLSRAGDRSHVAVYFPARADCGGWAGMGSISGTNIWINGVATVDVLAHELGHNLGLGHANTATCTSGAVRVPLSGYCSVQEYADVADVMGYGTNARSGNLNSALADQLGLARVHEVGTLPATVDIARLSDIGAVRALKVATAHGPVYVDFRPAQGRDVRRTAWAGVQVHRLVVTNGYPQSQLLDMQAASRPTFAAAALPSGASWEIPGTGQRLTVKATSETRATLTLESVTPPVTTPPVTSPPVTAPPVAVPVHHPVGALDRVAETSDRGVEVTGWVVDADTTAPVSTHVYVDGLPAAAWVADTARTDVGSRYPALGPDHGFSGYLPLANGRHTVCAYGINVGSGGNSLLGCRDVTVTNRAPWGALETALPYGDRIQIGGWAFDPDTAATIDVHVYVDGKAAVWHAGASRPDIKARYPGQSANHGFAGTVAAAEGLHTVCVYGIDANGTQNTLLGCRDVRVVNRVPIGSLDWVAVSGSQLTVGGWAFDPDTTASIPVHVYVDGVGAVLTANSGRADVKAAFPGQSANHGFQGAFTLSRGSHTVCVYGIDASGGTNALLGCRGVSV